MDYNDIEQLGRLLTSQIDNVESTNSRKKTRWREVERCYHQEEDQISLNVVEGMKAYAIGLYRMKADGRAQGIVEGIGSHSPYVQAIAEDGDQEAADEIQRCLERLAEHANFWRILPSLILTTLNTNAGMVRVSPKYETIKKQTQFRGMEFDWAHPGDTMAFPSNVTNLNDCRTVGHRYKIPMWRAKEYVASGKWRKETRLGGGANVALAVERSGGDYDSQQSSIDPDDRQIEVWQLFTLIDGDWHIVDLIRDTQSVAYKQKGVEPWWARLRAVHGEKEIYSLDSWGFAIKGLSLLISDAMTCYVQGSYADAFRPTHIIGADPGETKKWAPADLLAWPEGTQIVQHPSSFSGTGLASIIAICEKWIDGLSGQSQIQSSQNLPSGTTATAINALLASDAASQNGLFTNICEGIKDIWEVLYRNYRLYYREIVAFYGDGVALEDPSILERSYRFEVTGAASSGSKKLDIQKYQAVLDWSMSVPGNEFDPAAIVDAAVNAIGLSVDPESLKKGWFSEVREMATQIADQGIDPRQALMIGFQQVIDEVKGQQAHQMGMEAGLDENGDTSAFAEQGMGMDSGGDSQGQVSYGGTDSNFGSGPQPNSIQTGGGGIYATD
jgi:hypothetical protein